MRPQPGKARHCSNPLRAQRKPRSGLQTKKRRVRQEWSESRRERNHARGNRDWLLQRTFQLTRNPREASGRWLNRGCRLDALPCLAPAKAKITTKVTKVNVVHLVNCALACIPL